MFLDDERFPVDDGWVICRSYDEAVAYVTAHGAPSFVSFDNDLGLGREGYDFAKWLVERDMDASVLPDNFSFYVHSQNCVNGPAIRQYLINYLTHKLGVQE